MIQELKNIFGHLFEGEVLNEINQVETFKDVAEEFKIMVISDYIWVKLGLYLHLFRTNVYFNWSRLLSDICSYFFSYS
jgi:hypothetical protein